MHLAITNEVEYAEETIKLSIPFIFTAYIKMGKKDDSHSEIFVGHDSINSHFRLFMRTTITLKCTKASVLCGTSRICAPPIHLHKGKRSQCPWNDELYPMAQRAKVNENPKCHPNIAT